MRVDEFRRASRVLLSANCIERPRPTSELSPNRATGVARTLKKRFSRAIPRELSPRHANRFGAGAADWPKLVEIGDRQHLGAHFVRAAKRHLSLALLDPLPGPEHRLDEHRVDVARLGH